LDTEKGFNPISAREAMVARGFFKMRIRNRDCSAVTMQR
jgi:hypothetical protein